MKTKTKIAVGKRRAQLKRRMSRIRLHAKGRKMKNDNSTHTKIVESATTTANRRDGKMKRELWNQGLMYGIVGLLVFLAMPLFKLVA